MLPFLRRGWYVAAWSHDIGQKPLGRTILGEGVLLYRKHDGEAVAFEDRCPHRLAPLSLGRIEDDKIICGYHGLTFNSDGRCIFNPHGRGQTPGAARLKRYPLVERHHAAWIWTGEPDRADASLIPDFSILDQGTGLAAMRRDHIVMTAPWDLIVDNLLDLSHVNFLHDGILGNAAMVPAENVVEVAGEQVTVARRSYNVPPPGLFDSMFHQDGRPADVWMVMRWDAPSALLLDVGLTDPGRPREEGTGLFGIHLLTPETATTTHYHFAAVRWNIRSDTETEEMKQRISDMRYYAFVEQDMPMIAAQARVWANQGSNPRKPMWLDIDAGIARWRRIVQQKHDVEQPRDVFTVSS